MVTRNRSDYIARFRDHHHFSGQHLRYRIRRPDRSVGLQYYRAQGAVNHRLMLKDSSHLLLSFFITTVILFSLPFLSKAQSSVTFLERSEERRVGKECG